MSAQGPAKPQGAASIAVFKEIRVLVVDDSNSMCELVTRLLNDAPDITVVGTASNGLEARDQVKALNPDVITLDVTMPGMDGISFLENLMRLRPMPVVMLSSHTTVGADVTLQALQLGAVSAIAKPRLNVEKSLAANAEDLCWEIRNAAAMSEAVRCWQPVKNASQNNATATAQDRRRFDPSHKISGAASRFLVAMGASTGGTEAIHRLLSQTPPGNPGIVIAQHIPAAFSASFARRADRNCPLIVTEANNGEVIRDGHCYIAPGDQHLTVARSADGFCCRLDSEPKVNFHRPSVDRLFDSVATTLGNRAVGIILTGMGRDGATGLLKMQMAGAHTIGQDEATSDIYGMPRAAMELNAVNAQMALDAIPDAMVSALRRLQRR
ncbi:MAG: chemotaxis response regulator protein-glutamate methylesterase [Pseudomonadota bacterium]